MLRGAPFLTERRPLMGALLVLCALAAVLAMAATAQAAGTVTVDIDGRGDATGDGINCNESGGPDCSEFYADDETEDCDPERRPPCITITTPPTVSFTAAADRNGYAFSGWTGCDDVSGRTCTLTVTASTTVTASFTDATNPVVTSLSPSGGVHRGTLAMSASASDNSGTVSRVEFRVRGALVATDNSAPYSASFNTASVSDGLATVRATAFDPSGRSAFVESSITIDNTAPVVNVTGGPNGQTFGPGSTQSWTFASSDATSGVQSVQCSVVATGSPASFGSCSGGSSSHSVSGRPEGSYTFSVRARDNAGNETIVSRTFTIDATPPQTSITTGPADGSSSSSTTATFEFSASEPGSTFACRVYLSGTTPGALGACSGAGSHTASGLSPGTYVFEVAATDQYGNADGTPATRTFTVTAPTGGSDGGDAGGAGGGGAGGTAGGGGTTPSPDTVAPTWIFKAAAQRSAKTRRIAFTMTAGESCVLSVTAKLGKKRLGKLTKALAAGTSKAQRLKLTKKGLNALTKALRSKKVVKVTLVITCVDGAGNTSKATRRVKVKR